MRLQKKYDLEEIKHITNFPTQALKNYLNEVGFDINDLNGMVFYDKPFLKFGQFLETYNKKCKSIIS